MRKTALFAALSCVLSGVMGGATAANLMDVYRDALANDPQYAAARANRLAGAERTEQGRAGLLPTVGFTANTVWNDSEFNGVPRQYNSNAYELRLTQPLLRWQNWLSYDQGKLQTAQAEAQFVQAGHDLVLRVTQAYFDVQVAAESLRTIRAQKTAISQQLELAKKSYEVGTATITDTHEAQSRYDLALAQEIAGENDLEIKRRALQAITGKEYAELDALKPDAALSPPQPADMQQWVENAEKGNPAVLAQQAAAEIAAREADKSQAGHLPTVDLVATSGRNRAGFSATTGNKSEVQANTVGLFLTVPLYQGGSISSRARETAAQRDAARATLDAARRSAAQSTRQAYLGVASGLSQVKALQAAVVSSQAALDSNRLGYQVGVRINIDVLNAEQQLYSTQRDLAKARYDTVQAQLRLKAAVGSLADADVQEVGALLAPLPSEPARAKTPGTTPAAPSGAVANPVALAAPPIPLAPATR